MLHDLPPHGWDDDRGGAPALLAAFARVMSASISGMAAVWGGRGDGMGKRMERGERGIGLLPG